MPSAARGPSLLDEELTIIHPLREIATHESRVAQSRTKERPPAVLADRFQAERSYVPSMPRNPLDQTGVHDGDPVAIRACAEPCDGKVIVVRLDNQVMLKRYRRIDLACEEPHIDGYVGGTFTNSNLFGFSVCADMERQIVIRHT